jgi:ATP-dependent Clp protease protease subunit
MSDQEMDIEFESPAELPDPRVIGLYGDVNEENSQEAIVSLLHLHYNRETEIGEDGTLISLPIEFYVSTGGGMVAEMFAMYDLMRMVRKDCAIQTFGIGKVMSAGVLLLAAGTKGQRRIGKNCRIMLHRVLTGDSGSLHSFQATYKEAEIVEEMMFRALADETNLTVSKIKKIVSKNLDAFFSAEEAVEMGIADIIV